MTEPLAGTAHDRAAGWQWPIRSALRRLATLARPILKALNGGRLFWKFLLAFWLTLLLMGVGVGTAVWLRQQAVVEYQQDLADGPRILFMLDSTVATLRHGGLGALRELLNAWQQRSGAHVFVVDDAGQDLLGRAVPAETLALARRRVDEHTLPGIAREMAVGGRQYLFFVPARGSALDNRLAYPASPLLPIGMGLLASLICSALLAWYLSRPLRHLREAFAALAAGQFDTRVGLRMRGRRDEIADLGRDFDHMAEHLQSLIGSQRRLLHIVSHELRSPLARLHAAIGLARQQPEQREASLERIEREAGRLDTLVGELLTLSRLEAGVSGPLDQYVDLVELVEGIAEDARFEAEASGRALCFCGAGEAVVKARAELLYRAIENVVRNAVKYTAPGTTVEVTVEPLPAAGWLGITVDDRGPGIPEHELEAVFEPFYRSETSPATRGFGLGLAIARRAILAHGGTIQACNRPDGGLRVAIRLALPLIEKA